MKEISFNKAKKFYEGLKVNPIDELKEGKRYFLSYDAQLGADDEEYDSVLPRNSKRASYRDAHEAYSIMKKNIQYDGFKGYNNSVKSINLKLVIELYQADLDDDEDLADIVADKIVYYYELNR